MQQQLIVIWTKQTSSLTFYLSFAARQMSYTEKLQLLHDNIETLRVISNLHNHCAQILQLCWRRLEWSWRTNVPYHTAAQEQDPSPDFGVGLSYAWYHKLNHVGAQEKHRASWNMPCHQGGTERSWVDNYPRLSNSSETWGSLQSWFPSSFGRFRQ